MLESLLGTLFGGAFRLIPEVMSWMDKKDERKHELSMFDKQLEADKRRAEAAQTLAVTENTAKIDLADIQAIIEATKAQGQLTGIKWVDAFNSAIRPLLALQWLIILWPAVVVAGFLYSVHFGANPLVAMKAAFGPEEKAMASAIASFWLVDRSLRKISGK